MIYLPRKQFRAFHERHKRWGCIVAHRRSGKTVACTNELITRGLASPKINPRFRYIAPFYNQAKSVAWDYLKQYSYELDRKINESELSIEFTNFNEQTAKIRLFGADNPDALRGQYSDGDILDEFGDMKPSVWSSVIRPSLADRNGWAAFIGTPKGHNEFFKINQMARTNPDWFYMMLRASQSRLLPADELSDAKKMMSEEEYEREFECSFDAAIAGAVYGRWMSDAQKEGRIGKVAWDRKRPVYTAWDLGYSDTTVVWFFQIGFNEITLIDYYENNQEGIDHYCDVLKTKPYKYGKHWVPQDASHALMAAGGRSIVQQAYKANVEMFVVAETTHMNAQEATRQTLPICWFDEEKCEVGIESLRQYQYEFDEDKKIYRKVPRHDWTSHASKAFEIIARVWQVPKEDKPTKPRFLHEMTANEVFWPKDTTYQGIERI